MVHRALAKSSLVFGTKKTIAQKELAIAPDAGLLFPSRDSIEIGELDPDQRPSQLVVIDGTWSQAKSLHRALPQLQSLPTYKLAPTQPGQYRIRLELILAVRSTALHSMCPTIYSLILVGLSLRTVKPIFVNKASRRTFNERRYFGVLKTLGPARHLFRHCRPQCHCQTRFWIILNYQNRILNRRWAWANSWPSGTSSLRKQRFWLLTTKEPLGS